MKVATGGHYSNFTGDGLMALYGLNGETPAVAATQALRGARDGKFPGGASE